MSEVAQRFAENLKQQLAKSSLTQEQLAAQAEIHRTQITKLLTGEQVPRLDTAIKLAGALGVKPQVLIQGITWDSAAAPGGRFKISDS